MDILIAANQKVYFNTRVFLHSLTKTNKNLQIYLAYSDIQEKFIEQLAGDVEKSGNGCRLHPVQVNRERFKDVPVSNQITQESYYRLLLLDIFPDTIDRVLYMDTDIIVLKPLEYLYNIPFNKEYAAAVDDIGMKQETEICKYVFEKIGFSDGEFYFNGGVILFNLRMMRRDFTTEFFLDFIREKREMLTYHDQDVLNVCFRNRIKELPYIFNCRPYWFPRDKAKWIKENAYIIHYGLKPWNAGSEKVILADLFWKNALELGYKKEYLLYLGRVFCVRVHRKIRYLMKIKG